MSWLDRARELAGEAIGNIPENLPIIGPAVREIQNDERGIVAPVLNAYDVPRQVVGRPLAGALALGVAGTQVGMSEVLQLAGASYNASEGRRVLGAAGRHGLRNPIDAATAAFEEEQADNPWFVRGAVDILTDPLTYLTGGESAVARAGAGAVARGAARGGARGLLEQGAGRALQVGNLPDLAADRALAPVTGAIGRGIKQIPKVGKLFELSPKDQIMQGSAAFNDAIDARDVRNSAVSRNRGEQMAEGELKTQTGMVEGPRVARDSFAFRRIRERQARDPFVQQAVSIGDEAKQRILSRQPGNKGGIGYRRVETRPGQFVGVIETPEELNDFALLGRKIMMTAAPVDENDPLNAIDRARNGMLRWQDAMLDQIGEENRANIPMILERQLQMEGASVTPQKMRGAGRMTRSATMPKTGDLTEDQLIEEAAAWGAAHLQLSRYGGATRQFTPKGIYYHTGRKAPVNFRDILDENATDPIGMRFANRESFGRGFDEEFGQEGAWDKLGPEKQEIVWNKSVDSLYNLLRESSKPKADGAKKKIGPYLTPNMDELASIAVRGEEGKLFYWLGVPELRDTFSNEADYNLMIRLIAATSPRNKVKQNIDDALRHYVDFKVDGEDALQEVFTPQEIEKFGLPGSTSWGKDGFGVGRDMGTRRGLVLRAISGEELEGPKVNSFATNYMDNADADALSRAYEPDPASDVPIETQKAMKTLALKAHALAKFAFTNDVWQQNVNSLPGSPNRMQYQVAEQAGNMVARELGMTPEEAQAAMWLSGKKMAGANDLDTSGEITRTMAQKIGAIQGEVVNRATGEIFERGVKNIDKYTTEAGRRKVRSMWEAARKGIEEALGDSSARGRTESLTPELEYRSGQDDLVSEIYHDRVLSLVVNPEEQDAPKELLKWAFLTREITGLDMNRFRWFVNADMPGGDVNIDLVYFPRTQAPGVADELIQSMDERIKPILGNPEAQWESLDGFVRQMVARDKELSAQLKTDKKTRMGKKQGPQIGTNSEMERRVRSRLRKQERTASGFIPDKSTEMADIILDKIDQWKKKADRPAIRDAIDYDVEQLTTEFDIDPLLSQQENDVINRTLKDGTSYRRFFDDRVKEIEDAKRFLADRGLLWDDKVEDPRTWVQEQPNWENTDKDQKKLILKVLKDESRYNILKGDSREIAKRALDKQLFEDAGMADEWEKSAVWRELSGTWKELALLSPRYHAANIVGGLLNTAISGKLMAPPVVDAFKASIRRIKAGGGPDWSATKIGEIAEYKYGDGLGAAAVNVGTADLGGTGKVRAKSSTRKLLRRIPGAGDMISKAAVVPEASAAVAQLFDGLIRGATKFHTFDSVFERELPTLMGKVQKIADTAGVRLDVDNMFPLHPATGEPTYNPGILKEYWAGLGVKEGYANRMSREVAEAINVARAAGTKAMEHHHFSYRKTNLDMAIGKFVPFHYWASRAVPYYLEEAMRNPLLVSNFVRAQEGLDRAQDDPGLSARQKGFLKILDGPQGFTLLMNPDALFGAAQSLGLRETYTPEGETELGGVMRWMKGHGIGLFPWIDSTFNVIGAYGSTFEPDFLGIRHRALVAGVVNWARGEGILGESNVNPGSAPYAEAMGNLRGEVSKWTSTFLPDWMSQPVQPVAAGSIASATLDTIIENRLIAENPGMTNGQLVDIMNNPDSPEYKSAYQDVSRAGVLTQILNFTAPVQSTVRENSRDVRTAITTLTYDAAESRGVTPWEFTPTAADVEFATTYRNQTGKDWAPGDFQDANDKAELARAVPEARGFIIAEQEYNNLGSQTARDLDARYRQIQTGEWMPAGISPTIGAEQRELVAQEWLRQNDPRGETIRRRQLQLAYRATHPEFEEFKKWQSGMFKLQSAQGGDFSAYRAQVSAGNPNAAAYFARKMDEIKERFPQARWASELNQATTSADAWFAITGRARKNNEPDPLPTGSLPFDPSQQQAPQYQSGPPAPAQNPWMATLASYQGRAW